MKVNLFYFLFAVSLMANGQSKTYPCQYSGNEILSKMVGTWKVETTDRTSPGVYENNTGVSVISTGIHGCSVQEMYHGIFKERNFAVQTSMLMTDSLLAQRTYLDSEHANVMILDGAVSSDKMELRWVRNAERKKMQVKFELYFLDDHAFEWKTHLTTDFGESWQLTHHWKYGRAAKFEPSSADHQRIQSTISNYHDGLSIADSELVLGALSDQFIMFNGNYSGDALNWQAHMYLSGTDLMEWPEMFVKEAGPYQNEFEIVSIYLRGEAALVVTSDSGSNKFRQWKDEQTTWLLGLKGERWEILGYYLRDIKNP